MNDKIQITTDDSFEQVINSQPVVLMDFWAPWCAPCKALAPVLDEVADTYEGKILIAKLNIDDSDQSPQKYGVRGIPTMLVFKNGEVTATKVGALNKVDLCAFLDEQI
jgi:thioredoxin 1